MGTKKAYHREGKYFCSLSVTTDNINVSGIGMVQFPKRYEFVCSSVFPSDIMRTQY